MADIWEQFGGYSYHTALNCAGFVKSYMELESMPEMARIIVALKKGCGHDILHSEWEKLMSDPGKYGLERKDVEFIGHFPPLREVERPPDGADEWAWEEYYIESDEAWEEYISVVFDEREAIHVFPDEHEEERGRYFQFPATIDCDEHVIHFRALFEYGWEEWCEDTCYRASEKRDLDPQDFAAQEAYCEKRYGEFEELPAWAYDIPFDRVDDALEFWYADYVRIHGVKKKDGAGNPTDEFEIEPTGEVREWKMCTADGKRRVVTSSNYL